VFSDRQSTHPEERGFAEVIQTGAAVVIATPTAIKLGGQIKDKLSKEK
jgi:hypothetical protein